MATQGHAPLSPGARAQLVKHRALALGFARAGIADLAPVPHQPALLRWLEQGMAGTMRYMHRQAGRRIEPATILPGATRAVVVTRNYYSEDSPPTPGTGRVARYARGRDYHVALEPSLAELARYITSLGPKGTLAKPYCDAGPVPERELAQRAGLGADRCGTCRLCLDACPTHAFPDARVLDSRSCISYLTIEHRGEVDPALATGFGDWIFGCDICQEVCPWNVKFAEVADDPVLKPDPGLARLDLVELSRISDAEFRAKYGKTALSRPGASGMRRNARLALRFTAETAQIAEQDSRPE
ncbi:MAG: DUF1730 domain-containing protein [Gemmatimonadetes bacterium]|nr:DUF1730 domain-containing protein [Gemmatimonadota bacterium]